MNLSDKYRLWVKEQGLHPRIHRKHIADALEYFGEATILQIREEAGRRMGRGPLSERCAFNNLGLMVKAGLAERYRMKKRRGDGKEKHGRPYIYKVTKPWRT